MVAWLQLALLQLHSLRKKMPTYYFLLAVDMDCDIILVENILFLNHHLAKKKSLFTLSKWWWNKGHILPFLGCQSESQWRKSQRTQQQSICWVNINILKIITFGYTALKKSYITIWINKIILLLIYHRDLVTLFGYFYSLQ